MKRSLVYAVVPLIALIALFLGLRLWASARAVAIVGPSAMKPGPNGAIYIMSNDTLYMHDRDGGLLDKVPMSRFGIDTLIGDFWVYQNGELLLRRPVAQSLTLSGEAELFARTGAGEKDRLGTGESILQRCSMETFQCRTFGTGGEVFDKITAFSLLVDEGKGITYLSDVIGHQLLMLGENGKIIARSNTSFLFPNNLLLDDDGLLYVSDTNHHRVVAVRAEQDRFGAIEKEFRIVDPRNALRPTWPMAQAHAADGTWWVINAGDNMSYGIVMVLSEKGAFERVVSLPDGADPLRLVASGDTMLITDPSLMRVYSVGKSGVPGEDFGSQLFKLDLSELRRERRLYELIASVFMWALLVLLACALVVARQARVQEAAAPMKQAGQPASTGALSGADPGTRRYDYHSAIGFYRVKFTIITVVLVSAAVFYVLISRGLTLFHKQFFPAALLAHFVSSFFEYLHLKRFSVEMNERGIAYQGISRSVSSPWGGVRKVSVYGASSRIVTDHGNFTIGPVEPAGDPPRGLLDLYRGQRMKYHKELVEEIQKRAPQAKVNISWLVRFQWKRIRPVPGD